MSRQNAAEEIAADALVAARRAIALATDKLRELEAQALYLAEFVASGTLKKAVAFDALIEAAENNGLCVTSRAREEIEHVIAEGLSGRSAGVGYKAESTRNDQSAARERRLIVINAADVKPEKYVWVWPGRLALGKHTMVAGEPEAGKSQLMMAVGAAVTTGSALPCGEGNARRGSLIILSAEDGVADTMVPRLLAAGAEMSRVHIVKGTCAKDGNGVRTFNLQADIDLLKKKIDEVGDVCLVCIDPISSYLGKVDSHKNAELRAVLEPITQMAEDTRVAVLSITHFSKGSMGAPTLHRFIGSIAFTAAPRAAFVVVKDPEDEDRRLFLHGKNNLHARCQGLAFRLEQRLVDDDILASHIVWESEPVSTTADQLTRSGAAEGEAASLRAAAKEFLREALSGGEMSVVHLEAEARAAGLLGQDKPILQCRGFRHAHEKLHVQGRREGFGPGARYFWRLPVGPMDDTRPHG